MTINQIPNLDCETPEALMQFWLTHQGGRQSFALGLIGPGSRRATADLANYASNKATAMQCRLRGDITTALRYEGICDRIYKALPEVAQW